MSMIRSAQGASWLPEDFGSLLDTVIQEKAIAARTATTFATGRQKVGFPLWVSDPAVGWYNELDEISLTDGDTAEVVVVPTKTAGITLVSNELIQDSDPAIASSIAGGLANQIVGSVDSAYLGNTTSKGPNGLQSVGATVVSAGTSLSNLDPFIAARYAAELHAAHITHWVMHPTTAQAISQLKIGTSFNQPLVEFVDDGILIAGIPVLTSLHTDAGTLAWGIDASQVRYVLRRGTTLEVFPAITTDGQYLRAISRIGFGFLNPTGVVRIAQNASKTLTINGSPTGGTYTLLVNGTATAALAYNANAAAIKAAIVAVDNDATAADVTVTGTGPFTISGPFVLSHGTDALTGGTTPSTTVA